MEAGPALSVCVGGAPEELDPIYATETADQTVLVHLYENLMRKTGDGSGGTTVTNGAAKSVSTEENADGTVTWTFKLRKAEWSDGRAVRAGDFVFAWQRLADPANDSPSASLLSVVAGYDAVRETGDVSLLQVTAEDDSTLVVVLNGKFDWFLTEVCTAPATMPLRQDLLQEETAAADGETAEAAAEPAEAAPWWNDLTGLVTNGPYQVSGYEAGEALTLEASETYRNSFSGPQTLTFRFAETAEAGQDLYDAGEVDFLGILPAEQLTALIEAESRTLARELSVQAVVFNCAQDTLMDARVRRALTLTADRSAAAEAAGATAYAAEGLIPPGVPGSGEQDFRTDGGVLLDNDPAHRDELAEEARGLLAGGVRELVLVAQDLTSWGSDFDTPQRLPHLLDELLPLDRLTWLRLLYLYPSGVTPELLRYMREAGPQLLPYFDIPLQHAHPEVLTRMGRPFANDPRRVVDRVREALPEAALRTTFIVGYPGETEEHFQALCRFVEETRFRHLGVFAYQAEEGTPAAAMSDQVPMEVREERRATLMEIQAEISEQQLQEAVGQTMPVLVDAPHDEWPGLHVGRVWFQAPEVDGITYVSGLGVAPGALVQGDIVESSTYDLTALA